MTIELEGEEYARTLYISVNGTDIVVHQLQLHDIHGAEALVPLRRICGPDYNGAEPDKV